MHLIGLMQQQPVYVCYSQVCICERRLHHLRRRNAVVVKDLDAAARTLCHEQLDSNLAWKPLEVIPVLCNRQSCIH